MLFCCSIIAVIEQQGEEKMTELAKLVGADTTGNLVAYAKAADGAFADNTSRARTADSRIFADWCSTLGVPSLPAAPETISAFLDAQASQGKALATVRRYASTIATMHDAAKVNPNPTHSEMVKLALKRIARASRSRQGQAAALTWGHIRHALGSMGRGPRAMLDAALVCVGFDTLCRRSELVALQAEDMERHTDGSATVLVRRSKCDQEGRGRIAYLSPTTVEHLDRWLSHARIEQGPLFRSMDRHGNVSPEALSPMGVARAFKRVGKVAGIEVNSVSGHSARVGAAQDMAAADVELAAIMQAGGWKSATMPARYSERLQARRSGMAKLAAIQGR